MRPIIEFCVNNMHHHRTDVIMKKLEENSDYDVIEYGCLGNCGQCYMEPYALVNGDIVNAATVDDLYTEIMTKIEQYNQMFE